MLSWLSGASVRIDSITRMLGPGAAPAEQHPSQQDSQDNARPQPDEGCTPPPLEVRATSSEHRHTTGGYGRIHPDKGLDPAIPAILEVCVEVYMFVS